MKSICWDFPLEELKEKFSEVLDDKIVVISVFGKSSLLNCAHKKGFTYELFNIELPGDTCKGKESCQLDLRYDKVHKILYFFVRGCFDAGIFLNDCFKNTAKVKTQGFLTIWSELRADYARILLFVFAVSHIIISIHPSHTVDLNFINLLKTLSYVRKKYQTKVSSLLRGDPGCNKEWGKLGRLTSPRLLFLFSSCPEAILSGEEEQFKKFKRRLEDQIYSVLKRLSLVKAVSDHAFFSIAPNDEFVFVCRWNGHDYFQNLVTSAIHDCGYSSQSSEFSSSDTDILEDGEQLTNPFSQLDLGEDVMLKEEQYIPTLNDKLREKSLGKHEITEEQSRFESFLMGHVRAAQGRGFYDNVGKAWLSRSALELPTLGEWLAGVDILLLSDKEEDEVSKEEFGDRKVITPALFLNKTLGKEVFFSEARCSKVYPLALLAYKESLPSAYGAKMHKERLDAASALFVHHARGPFTPKFLEKLKIECEDFWKGRKENKDGVGGGRGRGRDDGEDTMDGKWTKGDEDRVGVHLYASSTCSQKGAFYNYEELKKDCLCSTLPLNHKPYLFSNKHRRKFKPSSRERASSRPLEVV